MKTLDTCETERYTKPDRLDADTSRKTSRLRASQFVSANAITIAIIALVGVLAIVYHQRSSDFISDDVFYADAARSLLKHGVYGINGRPEINQPPGLPAMLAGLFALFGYGRSICLNALIVTQLLGFLAAFKLLKSNLPERVAAAICLLLVTSPISFQMVTQYVSPCFPFLLTSCAALLACQEFESVEEMRGRVFWGAVLIFLVAASIMIASAGIALVLGIFAACTFTILRNWQLGLGRVKRLLPVLLIGFAVQGAWMARKGPPLEWPEVPGYPASYLQQLKVKRGNFPEAGMATLSDIPKRIETNLFAQADLMAQVILRHGVNETKIAVVTVPVILITFGWMYSVFVSSGQGILEWYFLAYEGIYLLWPWDLEPRFFLPILPLACLYAWRGLKAVAFAVELRPRLTGILWFPMGMALAASGADWIYANWHTGLGDLPDELLIPLWFVSAVLALRMAFTNRVPRIPYKPMRWRDRSATFILVFATAVVVMLVVIGFGLQASVAQRNTKYPDLVPVRDTVISPLALEVEAGSWLREHTSQDSVVMARHLPTVYHYAQRKLVWFPPSSDADILERGIARHKVDYLVVIKHRTPYYWPDDDYCFEKLSAKYGSDFHLAFQDHNLSIYRVDSGQHPEHDQSEVNAGAMHA